MVGEWLRCNFRRKYTTELTKAINEIDSPVFKESFTALVKRDMEDGKISNNEMYKLSEIYTV